MKYLIIYLAAVIIDAILEYKWYRSLKEVVENNGEKFEYKSQIIKGILIRCFFLNIISMLSLYAVSKLNDEELTQFLLDEYHNIIKCNKSNSRIPF